MKGLHAEVRGKYHKSVENYIIVSRVLQGQDDFRYATIQEKNDVVLRFNTMTDAMAGFRTLKHNNASVDGPGENAEGAVGPIPGTPPKTGFFQTKNLSFEERKNLHALKNAWKNKNKTETVASVLNPSANLSQGSASPSAPTTPSFSPENDEMERAIRESVAQTSNGDHTEDARIEAQIRASVKEMRRVAEERKRQEHVRDWKAPLPPELPVRNSSGKVQGDISEDITDEEFEALVAEAVRQSLIAQVQEGVEEHGVVGGGIDWDEDEYLRQAMQESMQAATVTRGGDNDGVYDEDLKKAMEESEKAHQEHLARTSTERTEEDIIMEYVKKQSLVEEEYRRQKAQGKQSIALGAGDVEEEEDEDLKRAMEESLKISGKEGGPSSSA